MPYVLQKVEVYLIKTEGRRYVEIDILYYTQICREAEREDTFYQMIYMVHDLCTRA